MFEHLAKYRKIVVTGPQRSGTTICARMVAADTGHEYVDEDRFGVSQEGPFWELVKSPLLQVIQAPGMAHICHELAMPDLFVLFMLRKPKDIMASQVRIEWNGEEIERKKYSMLGGDDRPICLIKTGRFIDRQMPLLQPNTDLVSYETLANHWMWLAPEYRTNFGPRQWRLG
jgi:hypothetical protein